MFGSQTSWSSGRYISTFRFPKDVDFLKESRWLYDGPNRTGCCDGVPSLPRSIVTDHGDATVDLEILTRTSTDVTLKCHEPRTSTDQSVIEQHTCINSIVGQFDAKKVHSCLNRIMSVYMLLRTVVPRLLWAKVDRHNWGPTTSNYWWPPRLPEYSLLHINYHHRSLIEASNCVVLVLNTCGENGVRLRRGDTHTYISESARWRGRR